MSAAHSQAKVWVGFITYGATTAPYLPYFLASLRQQTYQDYKLVCFDNTPAAVNPNSEYLKQYPVVQIYHQGSNLGFSAAYNNLLAEAAKAGADYFLIINPDTVLDPEALERLVDELEVNPSCAAVAPKLRQWNFRARTRTTVLDSCGLEVQSGLRFIDLGQGEEDKGQYDQAAILGPSGAAGLFRLSVLNKIAVHGQYFDEAFFMYKEDCDLAYRLILGGFRCRLVSRAIIYHDRTASGGTVWQRWRNRGQRSVAAKRYAFINQHFLYIKYWKQQPLLQKFRIIMESIARCGHALLFEQSLLGSYPIIFKAMKFLKKY